jgi:hypothetical protein
MFRPESAFGLMSGCYFVLVFSRVESSFLRKEFEGISWQFFWLTLCEYYVSSLHTLFTDRRREERWHSVILCTLCWMKTSWLTDDEFCSDVWLLRPQKQDWMMQSGTPKHTSVSPQKGCPQTHAGWKAESKSSPPSDTHRETRTDAAGESRERSRIRTGTGRRTPVVLVLVLHTMHRSWSGCSVEHFDSFSFFLPLFCLNHSVFHDNRQSHEKKSGSNDLSVSKGGQKACILTAT